MGRSSVGHHLKFSAGWPMFRPSCCRCSGRLRVICKPQIGRQGTEVGRPKADPQENVWRTLRRLVCANSGGQNRREVIANRLLADIRTGSEPCGVRFYGGSRGMRNRSSQKEQRFRGVGRAREGSESRLREQGVGSSNLPAPTNSINGLAVWCGCRA